MFKNNRYVTRGIQEKVPVQTQRILWSILDDFVQAENQIDYIQVFRLTRGENDLYQIITHTQEVPSYTQRIQIQLEEAVEVKIFVIDDGANTTMLLAEEY